MVRPRSARPANSAGVNRWGYWRWSTSAVPRVVVLLVATGFGIASVYSQWHDVRAALSRLDPVTVGAALLAVLAGLAAPMQLWRGLLAAIGSPLPPSAAARIFFLGQLGKYLPGSVWPVLIQARLAAAHRIPRVRVATAAALTLLISLLAGLTVALAALPEIISTAVPAGYRWTFAACPVLLLALHPRLLNPMLNRLLRLARRAPLEQPLAAATLVRALGWALLSWLLLGLHVWLLAYALGVPPAAALATAVGGFAFAWCAGFLAVVAPAGAGVRDVLLVAILARVLSTADATAIALVSRAAMTLGDLIIAAGVLRFRRPESTASPGVASSAGHDGPGGIAARQSAEAVGGQ